MVEKLCEWWKLVLCGERYNVTLHLYLLNPHQVTTGTTSLTPRWDKCVNYVENSLVYATGRLFVNTHFQEDKKHMVRVFYLCGVEVTLCRKLD